MGSFSPKTRGRSWFCTIHHKNLENLGFTDEELQDPEYICKKLIEIWENSGKDRKAGVVCCISADMLEHYHMGCYGGWTTLAHVAKTLGNAHTELVMGNKAQLLDYTRKQNGYENGEVVVCEVGLENIEGRERNRSDLSVIGDMIADGLRPSDIFEENFGARRYAGMVYDAYRDKRLRDMPIHIDDMVIEWHFGKPGSGKSHYLEELADIYGINDIYVVSDYENGGFDGYLNSFADILFLDELRPFSLRFNMLLVALSGYTQYQVHARFRNVPTLWSKVVICSPYDPHSFYEQAVPCEDRKHESYQQLARRITSVCYHFRDEGGTYHKYSVPMSVYQMYFTVNDFMQEANRYAKAKIPDPFTELNMPPDKKESLSRLCDNLLVQEGEPINADNADEILKSFGVETLDKPDAFDNEDLHQ